VPASEVQPLRIIVAPGVRTAPRWTRREGWIGPVVALVGAGIGALILLAAGPEAAAQPASKVARIGLLGTVPLSNPAAARIWAGLFDGLRQLGYVEGEHFVVVGRYSEGRPELLPSLAAELVRLKVDVIVAAAYTPVAARGATSTIPIVMTNHGDPVGRGLVASLARPGGNVTGVSTLTVEVVGKAMQLLKEVTPRLSRVAVLLNPGSSSYELYRREAEDVARALALRLQVVHARTPAELAAAFSAATKESAGALVIVGDPMYFGERQQIVELAARNRLPLMTNQSEYPEAGGLFSYGADQRDSFRRAATYVDRILKGENPGTLPIDQATKLELVINLKTARALGLTIPPSVLLRAGRVIE
jgi:putative ABC transport system substrate-binding protein